MNSSYRYAWGQTSNIKWNINLTSEDVAVTQSGQTTLPIKLASGKSITLAAGKPSGETGVFYFRSVKFEGLNQSLTAAATFGSNNLTRDNDTFEPSDPIKWEDSYEIKIILTNETSSEISCTISSITVLTGTQSSTTFSWANEITSSQGYDVNEISKSGSEDNITLSGKCEENAIFSFPLNPSTGSPTITYSSNKTTVAEVNSSGEVTVKSAGEATITAVPEASDNEYYLPSSYSYTLSISETYQFLNLIVAGKRVTTGNNSNVFSDETVSFTPANNEVSPATPATLTLKGATINDQIAYSGSDDLTIALEGTNSITCYNKDCISASTSTNVGLTIERTNTNEDASLVITVTYPKGSPSDPEPSLIAGFKSVEYEGGLAEIEPNSLATGTKKCCITNKVYNDLKIYSPGEGAYPIQYYGNEYKAYKDNILYDNENIVSFDGDHTLTMNNALMEYSVISNLGELTIHLIGDNDIQLTDNEEKEFQSKNPNGVLSFTTELNDGTWGNLALGKDNYYSGFKNVDYGTMELSYIEEYSFYAICVPSLTVAGNKPKSDGSITGDGITSGTVTFAEANNYDASNSSTWPTLTLTGATISGGIRWNPYQNENLLIVINGKNTIENKDGSDINPAISTDNSELLLEITKGSDSGDASFKIRDFYDDGSYYAISGFSNSSNTETLLNGLYQLKLSSPNGVGRDNYTYISNNSGYETYMTIGYYTVHNIPDEPGYMENVFGDDGTPTVQFEKTDDGGVLTLNNASINGNVKSAIDHLKVYLIGSSDMTGINSNSTNRAFYYSGETAASLTFDSTDEDAGQITFHNIHEFVAIAQGYSITPNLLSVPSADGWAKQEYYDSEKPSEQCVVLLKDISYNVSVNGVPVTKSNANNIDGTGIVFTPADETEGTPATLTLNAASFTTSGQNAFESGLANLTVLLEGENIITCGGNSDKLFKGTVSGAKVTFAVDDTSEGSLGGQCLEANMFDGITPVYPEELIYTRSGDSYLIADVRVDLSDKFYGNNKYATFCEEQSDVYPKSDITPFVVTGVSGSSVTLQALSYIPKGVPVILGKTKNTATSASFSVNKLQSAGYEGDEVTASSAKPLYVLYNDQFVKVTDNTAIHRGRCYLELSASAGTRDSYSINAINGTSAIEGVRSEGVESEKYGDWFDLQGRRIDKPTAKGLYIQSGKKVVIR